jgi:signal transduction histidine kinase
MLIVQIALLALLSANPSQPTYPWHLARAVSGRGITVERVLRTEGSPVVDINGDGVEEYFVENPDDFSDVIYNQDGTVRAQLNYPTTKERTFLGALDINHDNRKELFFFYRNAGDTAFLRIWFPHGDTFTDQMLFSLPHNAHRPEGWNGRANPGVFMDVNDDGYEDILIPMVAEFDLKPRGIYAYDFHNQKILWFFPMAVLPITAKLADLNNDGKQEIVVSTYAPGNGAVVNGFDDNQGMLFVLSKDGKLLWQKEMGRFGSDARAEVADVDMDGKPEVVAYCSSCITSDTLPGQVFILDGATGAVKRYLEIKAKFRGIKVCDLNRDRKPKILLGGYDGILRVLDGSLSEVKEKVLSHGILSLADVRDLDGDGTQEIVLIPGYARLIILNEGLETLLNEEMGEESYCCPIRNGRAFRLLFTSPQSVSLFDIQKEPPQIVRTSSPVLEVATFIFAGLIILLLVFTGVREVYVSRFLTQAPCPVLLLDRRGRVRQANPKAKALLGEEALAHFRFPPQKHVAGCAFYPFSVWGKRFLLLEDKSEQASRERAVAWAGMAQSMAHEFKNPLSTLILATQRLQSQMQGQETVRYTETLLEELQRMRQRVDGFMRFLSIKGPELAPLDLKVLLARLREKFAKNLPPEVSLDLLPSPHLSLVLGDQSQLEVAFTNLIDNALTAVGPKGHVTIRACCEEAIRDDSKSCEIEIADDGPGISCENLTRLFTPYFTTKPSGSGLGLIIARKVIEDHGGTIRVESKEGIGTRVIVRLSVA